jgi:hypothetical protein
MIVHGLALAVLGLRREPGFATWHMFTTAAHCEFSLRTEEGGREFNPWDFLPATYLQLDRAGLEWFLWFLRRHHQLRLTGEVVLVTAWERKPLNVRETRVVD